MSKILLWLFGTLLDFSLICPWEISFNYFLTGRRRYNATSGVDAAPALKNIAGRTLKLLDPAKENTEEK